MVRRIFILLCLVSASFSHQSSCFDCLVPLRWRKNKQYYQVNKDELDDVDKRINQLLRQRASTESTAGSSPEPVKVYSLGYLAEKALQVTECYVMDSSGQGQRSVNWTIRAWPKEPPSHLYDTPTTFNAISEEKWQVIFRVNDRPYSVRIPLRLDRALALGSASDGPWRLGTDRFSSERSVCSTALQEGLSDLYDPDDYSKISYDDLRSDIIMFARRDGMRAKVNISDRTIFEAYNLSTIANKAISPEFAGDGQICHVPGFDLMWSLSGVECANKRQSAWGPAGTMCFIYKDWYFPITVASGISPPTCSNIFQAGLEGIGYAAAFSNQRSQLSPIELEEAFTEMAKLASKTAKSKRIKLFEQFRKQNAERSAATKPSSLIEITQATPPVETLGCRGADGLYTIHMSLLSSVGKATLKNKVIFGPPEAKYMLELEYISNSDFKVLGVFIGEPKQIISPVGLNCKAAMEYAVSSTYGSDYVSDELSLTALAGDIRRREGFAGLIFTEDLRISHITLGDVRDAAVEINVKKSGRRTSKKSEKSGDLILRRTCSLRGVHEFEWESYDKGQYKGPVLPLSGNLNADDIKEYHAVVFTFRKKAIPVLIEMGGAGAGGALPCAEALHEAFNILYDSDTEVSMDIMTPYEMVYDMERYLNEALPHLESKKKKSKKNKKAAQVEPPLSLSFPWLHRSSACIESDLDFDTRVKRASERSEKQRRKLKDFLERTSSLTDLERPVMLSTPPKGKSSPKQMTLDEAVQGLTPRRTRSTIRSGEPLSAWMCSLKGYGSEISWSWPSDGSTFGPLSEPMKAHMISNGKVRLSFTITPEDFGGQKHDDVVATICRTSLARAVEVKYGSGKALSEITLKAFENDLRPKHRLFGFFRRRR